MRARRAAIAIVFLESIFAGLVAAQPDGRVEEGASGERAAPPPIQLETLEPTVREQFERALGEIRELEGQPETPATQLASAYGEVGRLHHTYLQPVEAEWYYRRAHELAPGEFSWRYYLAVVLQESGRLDEAAQLLEQSLAVEPQRHGARLRLAEIYLEKDKSDLAEALFQRSLREHSSCPRARAGLGRIALAEERFAEAVQTFEILLDEYPKATGLFYPLGMAYRGLGDMEQARKYLAKTSAVEVAFCDPLMAELRALAQSEKHYLFRGSRLIEAGRREEAVEAFRRALEINPESVPARGNLALLLTNLGELEEAKRLHLELLSLNPELGASLRGVAAILALEGKVEEAENYLRKAITVQEDDWSAHAILGGLLLRRGASEEALQEFGRARRLEPSRKSIWRGEAMCLLDLARYEEALSLLGEAHGLFSQDEGIRAMLARLLAASPDLDLRDGKRALELALPLAKARAERAFLEAVALALAEEGRCEEAREWQEGAIAREMFDGTPVMVKRLRQRLQDLEKGPPCRPDYSTPEELFPGLPESVSGEDFLTPEESGPGGASADSRP